MASRTGPRASGTDGSDFSHRERVASHYKESVRQKSKLKFCLLFQLFLQACVVLWTTLVFSRVVKTAPDPWMLAWLISVIPALLGLSSIPKNKQKLMYVYAFGTIFTGIGPLMYGASILIFDVLDNYSRGVIPATQDWRTVPVKMAVVAFIIQLHAISIYFANKLISAWGTKGEKKS